MVLGKSNQKDNILSSTGLSPSMIGLSSTTRLEYYFLTFRLFSIRARLIPTTPILQHMLVLT
jgi:hypothetical protein